MFSLSGGKTARWGRAARVSVAPPCFRRRGSRSCALPGIASRWNSRISSRTSSGHSSRKTNEAAETLSAKEEAMFVMYFTEQPMSTYPADIGLEVGHTALMFSNKHFDPVAGSRLYNEYLEHYIYAEEQGVEGFMLNEHHNAPFCMQAKCNIFASILAAV